MPTICIISLYVIENSNSTYSIFPGVYKFLSSEKVPISLSIYLSILDLSIGALLTIYLSWKACLPVWFGLNNVFGHWLQIYRTDRRKDKVSYISVDDWLIQQCFMHYSRTPIELIEILQIFKIYKRKLRY